jgi:hypothetical protein
MEQSTRGIAKDTLKAVTGIAEAVEILGKNLTANQKNDQPKPTPVESEDDKKFIKRRLLATAISVALTGGLAVLTYWKMIESFGLMFGLFFGMGFLALIVFADEYILPGNTLKRISENAIASSILLGVFALAIISGNQLGNSFITTDTYQEERIIPAQPADKPEPDTTGNRANSTPASEATRMLRDSGDSERFEQVGFDRSLGKLLQSDKATLVCDISECKVQRSYDSRSFLSTS